MNRQLETVKNLYVKELKSKFGYEECFADLLKAANSIDELRKLHKQCTSKQIEKLRIETRKLFEDANIKDKSLLKRIELTMKYKKLWKLYLIGYRKLNGIPSPKTQRRNQRKEKLNDGTPTISVLYENEDSTKSNKSIKPIYTPMGGMQKN